MAFNYKIDEDFAVRIFKDGDTVPFWFQPDYPNGDKFDSMEEATTWADCAVASMDGESPFPPVGKNAQPEVRVPSTYPQYNN